MNSLATNRPKGIIAILLSVWCLAAPLAMAGDNYAFLVAVGDYDVKQLKPLAYTRNDVLEFSKALTESGFKPDNIVLMHDDLKTLKSPRFLPQVEKIRKEFELLLSSVDDDDSVIVAFAGHGVQFADDDRNFFCPMDADLEDPQHKTLISLKEIYEKLNQCPAGRKLLLVDACRNDPLSNLARSRDKVRLNSVTRPQTEDVPKGIVALFSCSAGQESYEWPEVKHGVFFQHVLSGWKGAADNGDYEVSLDELVAYTRRNTQSFTRIKLGALQTPHLKGEFNGTWVLRKLEMPRVLTSSIGMKLTLIPSGTFKMGSPVSEETRQEDEGPQHTVQISRPFYMGVYEVTQAEYEAVMGFNPSVYSRSGQRSNLVAGRDTSKFPVETISWYDAIEFCNKLSEKDNLVPCYSLKNAQRMNGSIYSAEVSENPLAASGPRGYRLPTEAEWEYACRANTTTPFHFGSALNGDKANVNGEQPYGTTTKGVNLGRTTSVGSYAPNQFGLFDMHGNTWEWCFDMYDERAYKARGELTVDPKVTSGSGSRVVRGWCWADTPKQARSANRQKGLPENRTIGGYGIRVVR